MVLLLNHNLTSLLLKGALADSALQSHQDIVVTNLSGATFTGNVEVSKNMKANDEKRFLFSDAGGAATGGIKHVSTSLDFYGRLLLVTKILC